MAETLKTPEELVHGLLAHAGSIGERTWTSSIRSGTVDGEQIDVGPEQAVCIPRGAVHRFDNNGSRDAKALCVITPAAIGPEYFREAFGLLNATAGGPPDRAKMAKIMRRHGLTPAAPPAIEAGEPIAQ
jgi:hypothetical protein